MTSACWPGGSTAVVVGDSTNAGPSMRWPAASAGHAYRGHSRSAPSKKAREQPTGPAGVPPRGGAAGMAVGSNASTATPTASTGVPAGAVPAPTTSS